MTVNTCARCETRYRLDGESAEPTCPRCAHPLCLRRSPPVPPRPRFAGDADSPPAGMEPAVAAH